MSNRREKSVAANGHARRGRLTLAVVLLAGTAACTAAPRYPIDANERPGDGGLKPWQPRYPVSPQDAAQNAADRASGTAVGPRDGVNPPAPTYPPRATTLPPPPSDDDGMHPVPSSSVDSSDLPPPGSVAPPAPAGPHLESEVEAEAHMLPGVAFARYFAEMRSDEGAGSGLELASVHHRHHAAKAADSDTSADDKKSAHRRHGRKSKSSEETATGDTPYQTSVRPGEKLADVAKRLHVSPSALVKLNDIKHPRHVHAGTVLKAPYRYSYEVQKGDTLYTISHRFDQDPEAVAKLNGLRHAAELQPGQAIELPPTASDQGARRHAAAEVTPVAAPDSVIRAALHKARRGDHLTRRERAALAQAQARDESARAEAKPHVNTRAEAAAEIAADAAANAEATPSRGRRGRPVHTAAADASEPATYNPPPAILRPAPRPASPSVAQTADIPPPVVPYASTPSPSSTAATTVPGPVATLNAPTYRPTYPSSSASSGTYAPSLGRARPTAPETGGGALTPSEIAAAGRGRFVWPLKGSVLAPFGDRGPGQHNDGVDIAAQSGDSVRAAAAGEVVYAGSSIPGFGNLVLVKHAGGWVTAYAHLNRIEVRMKDSVAQGDEIGQVGQTGAVDRPLLHFEVRYAPQPTEKARPVDPALVLPAGG